MMLLGELISIYPMMNQLSVIINILLESYNG